MSLNAPGSPGAINKGWNKLSESRNTYVAALMLSKTSRNANSNALAVSAVLELLRRLAKSNGPNEVDVCDVENREGPGPSRGVEGLGISFMTPVACHVGVLNIIRTPPGCLLFKSNGTTPCESCWPFPKARSGLSRFPVDVRACRLVMPLRMRRISSTS